MDRVARAAVTVGLVLAVAAPASALFVETGTSVAANTFTAATLQPGGAPTITWTCSGNAATGALTWAASPSTFVQGYRVYAGGSLLGSTAATSITVSAGRKERLTLGVEAYAHGWSSTRTSVTTRAC